jgi:uncharacterized protein YjiS (DUF1127 family)
MSPTFKLTHPIVDLRASFAFLLAGVVFGIRRVVRALKNRRDANLLAELDARMLADIGLTRSDLRDAYGEPLWRDPTDILARRARDRRRHRVAKAGFATQPAAPPLVPEGNFGAPKTNRTAGCAR